MKMSLRNLFESRILIVDDMPANVVMLSNLLDAAGYTNVISTTDSREVCDLCRNNDIDLILLDVRMPYISGIELTRLLQGIYSDTYLPILILTAQTDEATRHAALSAGAKDFINKPFDTAEVLQRIRNTLETRFYYKNQKKRADSLDAEVRNKTREIRELQLEIVQRLGRAVEYRDNETGAHIIRMSKSCQLLALAAGLSEAHSENILHASAMHDVGKIGIPDSILLKPGRLDEAERKIIETHSRLGFEILRGHTSELMIMAADVAFTHHERWDGLGYPRGLLTYDIPIEGRIAAICDVFDALTSVRPYKNSWPLDQAYKFFQDQAGKMFCPYLTMVFLDIFGNIAELRDVHPDHSE